VVRSGTSENAPEIGRIVPSWDDEALRLTIEPASSAAIRTDVFAKRERASRSNAQPQHFDESGPRRDLPDNPPLCRGREDGVVERGGRPRGRHAFRATCRQRFRRPSPPRPPKPSIGRAMPSTRMSSTWVRCTVDRVVRSGMPPCSAGYGAGMPRERDPLPMFGSSSRTAGRSRASSPRPSRSPVHRRSGCEGLSNRPRAYRWHSLVLRILRRSIAEKLPVHFPQGAQSRRSQESAA
jgi:hypothetical protein